IRRRMWMEVAQVDAETHRLHVKELQEGRDYLVRIFARNEIGLSDPLEMDEPVRIIRPEGKREAVKLAPHSGVHYLVFTLKATPFNCEPPSIPGYKEGDYHDDDQTPSASFTTDTSSSWIRD